MQLKSAINTEFSTRTYQRGFTLVELVLVLVIMAGITVIVAYSAQRAVDRVNYETSKAKIENIKLAIDRFAGAADRLPCPADPTLAKTNANYGRENCAGTWTNAEIDPTPGAVRTRPMTTTLPNGADTDKVLLGALPSYVQFPAGTWIPLSRFVPALDRVGGALILDQTNSLPTYAVTRHLAKVNAGGDYGNITMRDESGNNVSGTANDVRYVVVLQSYRGAGTCPAAGQTRDNENCNNDSIFNVAPRALSGGLATYFDDVVLFNNTIFDNKWVTSTADPNASNQSAVYVDNAVRNIGVQKTIPTEKLDVSGALRADSNVRAPLICDKPSSIQPFPNGTSTTLMYTTGVYNNPSNVIVKKITAAGVTTRLVAGTDYSVGAYVAGTGGVITLTNPPIASDTITIESGLCFDPLSVVKKFDKQLLSPNEIAVGSNSMACPKLNFSTTMLRGDSNWWKDPAYADSTNPATYQKPQYDRSLLNIEGIISYNGTTYRKLNFRNVNIHVPNSPYYADSKGGANFEGRYLYLDEDPEPRNGTFNGVTYNDGVSVPAMAANNKTKLKIYKTLCSYKNDVSPGSCTDKLCAWEGASWNEDHSGDVNGTNKVFNTTHNFKSWSSLVVLITPPGGTQRQAVYGTDYTVSGGNGGVSDGPEAVGTVTMTVAPAVGSTVIIQRNQCDGATATLLVEEPAGGMTPQNYLRYIVSGERYLAGTELDDKGVLKPICKDLEITPLVDGGGNRLTQDPGTGTPLTYDCPGTQTVRAVRTNGTVVCNP